MFGQKTTKKHRRLTPKEFADELEDAKIWKRPPRTYTGDPPYYPWCVPEPIVNFALNFKF